MIKRSVYWTPEVKQILESRTHGDVVAGPAEYANPVNDIRSVPNDGISQFVSPPSQLFDEFQVNGYPLILPPHVGNVDHAMGFRLQER